MKILTGMAFKPSHSKNAIKKLINAFLYQDLPLLKIHLYYFSLMHLEYYREHLATLINKKPY